MILTIVCATDRHRENETTNRGKYFLHFQLFLPSNQHFSIRFFNLNPRPTQVRPLTRTVSEIQTRRETVSPNFTEENCSSFHSSTQRQQQQQQSTKKRKGKSFMYFCKNQKSFKNIKRFSSIGEFLKSDDIASYHFYYQGEKLK